MTPEWTEKDKRIYRKAKQDLKSGKSILKEIIRKKY